jgi:predicted Fe-S protein YdhL (DUF1289 family)
MSEPPVASPCTKVCTMDAASGLCIGCLRTLDEIACWGGMTDDERRRVLDRVEERRREARG